MSFSQDVKNELCSAKLICNECRRSMLYGMILFENKITETIWLYTRNKNLAELFSHLLEDIKIQDIKIIDQNGIYSVMVLDIDAQKKLYNYLKMDDSDYINDFQFKKDCCKAAFLRGVYLVSGTIVNPLKEYHLEINIYSEVLADKLYDALTLSGMGIKKTLRNKNCILYLKESNQIEDMLTYLGAVKSSLSLMNLKIEKELRNNVNRITNCETANIEKTVNASVIQIEKIKKIRDTIGIESLPQELQDVALMRLLNPDSSLNELCKLSTNKISRSGLNHRLKKIMEIADNL